MKVQIAVYTATEGFDWQPGSVYGKAELEKYHAMIGRFPDILMDVVPYGGVFVCDGRVVFYRYLVFEKGDSRGRDALYCVLGTLSFDEMRKVDLAQVFASRQFSRPHKPFPTELDVEEQVAERQEPRTVEELEQGLRCLRSAGDVGYYATFFPDGKFFCRMNGDRNHPQLDLDYAGSCLKPAVVAVPQPETPPLTSSRQELQDRSRPAGEATEPRPRQNAAIWILSGLLALALVALGAVLFMTGHPESERKEEPTPIPELPQVQVTPPEKTNGSEGVVRELPHGGQAGGARGPKANVVQIQVDVSKTEGRQSPKCSEPGVAKPEASKAPPPCPPFKDVSRPCPSCNGNRYIEKECEVVCAGTNWVECADCRGTRQPKCRRCDGRGEVAESWRRTDRKIRQEDCQGCAGEGRVTVRMKLCPVCKGALKVRACPKCIKGSAGLNHHEMRDGRFVLCDARGQVVSPAPCPICHGEQEVENCEFCNNQGYVDDVPSQVKKEVLK